MASGSEAEGARRAMQQRSDAEMIGGHDGEARQDHGEEDHDEREGGGDERERRRRGAREMFGPLRVVVHSVRPNLEATP